MSQEIDQPRPTDLTIDEAKAVEDFKERGMPGLDRLPENDLKTILELYLDGKTYYQISRVTRVPKVLIMYLSQRFDWCTAKHEQLAEMEHHLYQRTILARTRSQDFLLNIQHAYQKRIGKQINEYLRTGDEVHMDKISLKEIDKFIKTIESLEKLTADKLPKKPKAPLVGINPGRDGVVVKQTGDNTIEISPKESTLASKLREMAEQRRQQDAIATQAAKDAKEKK